MYLSWNKLTHYKESPGFDLIVRQGERAGTNKSWKNFTVEINMYNHWLNVLSLLLPYFLTGSTGVALQFYTKEKT